MALKCRKDYNWSMGERQEGVLVRIEARGFVAGVVIGERAAPVVKYMVGWEMGRIRAYCAKRGWRCEEVGGGRSPDIDNGKGETGVT